MINVDQLLNDEFTKEKETLDLTRWFKEDTAYLTIIKISYDIRNQYQTLEGRKFQFNDDGTKVIEFTNNYSEINNKKWRLLIEYGIDKKDHGFIDERLNQPALLTVSDFEKMGTKSPELLDYIIYHILKFNGMLFVDEEETEKK